MKHRKASRAGLFTTEAYRAVRERLAANARRLREARGWTQEEAAERCGELHPTLYRSVEAGRPNATVLTISRLCQGFGVDVAEFFLPAPPLEKRPRGRPKAAKPEGE